jgi:hypothetical protein
MVKGYRFNPVWLVPTDNVSFLIEGGRIDLMLAGPQPITAVEARLIEGDEPRWVLIAEDNSAHPAYPSTAPPPKPPKRFTLKAGRLLFISDGAYSSYSITGLFVVLKDFDPFIEAERYLADKPAERERYTFQTDAYLAQLLAAGYLAEVDHHELHLSDYHSVDDMWVSGPRVDK